MATEFALAVEGSLTRDKLRIETPDGKTVAMATISIALIAGGGVLAVLGGIEIGDGDSGTDEDTDTDDVAGTDDWDTSEKVMLGSGIAAAGVGAILLMTGGRRASPSISARRGRVTVGHTIRF